MVALNEQARAEPRACGGGTSRDRAACHGNGGQSLNSGLFDRRWLISSGTDADLRRIIRDGIQSRGMPSYRDLLSSDEINELIALIHNREDTHGK